MIIFSDQKLYQYRCLSENQMQEEVDEFLRAQTYSELVYNGMYVEKRKLESVAVREWRIKEVGRISDHILVINKKRIINFECKLDDISKVIHQAQSHLEWCDYSVIIMPGDGRYIANSYKKECISKGIGMFYWLKGIGMFEFILPKYNKSKNKLLRAKVLREVLVKCDGNL